METEFIILGQGICGTLLSHELERRGRSFLVFDPGDRPSSSRTAAGLINPVTGKRHVTSWMYEQFLPVAAETYEDLGQDLDVELIRSVELLQFPSGPEEKALFYDKAEENEYLRARAEAGWEAFFHFQYGTGCIAPCWLVDGHALLDGWAGKLQASGRLRREAFDFNACTNTPEGIRYKDLSARTLICCEGPAALKNPCFGHLPFSLNKGEAVLAQIPGLPRNYVYKERFKIIPVRDDLFWVGSSFEWKYDSSGPAGAFREKLAAFLDGFLKLPYTIIAHHAAERPSTVDYRPFVGLHPNMRSVGILNGMGTKGYSQAPFFARQLAEHLCNGSTILPQADVSRFNRILSREQGKP